jgi:hypothetical protein
MVSPAVRHRVIGLALALVLAALAVVAIHDGYRSSQSASPSRVKLASEPTVPQVAAPSAAQVQTAAAQFAVFGQAATAGDALPTQSAYSAGVPRRIGPSSSSVAVWGVVTAGQICVTVNATTGPAAGGPAACNTPAELAEPNQLLATIASSSGSGSQVIAGIAPNGVSGVTINFSDGSSVIAPVKRNGFLYIAPASVTFSGFAWTNAGGTTATEQRG